MGNMKTTKLFMDLEFTGLQQDASLISIGMVDEDGYSFYAEVQDYQLVSNKWVIDNVINNLLLRDKRAPYRYTLGSHTEVKCWHNQLNLFLSTYLKKYDKIEFWLDCGAYDWVLFCNIFGGAFNLPNNVYYIPFDIATLLKAQGWNPDINREEFARLSNDPNKVKHNALWDAKVIKECYKRLGRNLPDGI